MLTFIALYFPYNKKGKHIIFKEAFSLHSFASIAVARILWGRNERNCDGINIFYGRKTEDFCRPGNADSNICQKTRNNFQKKKK